MAVDVPNDIFPFEYKGGGYFRKKGVPIGDPAEILHGEQAIEYIYKKNETGREG